MKHTSLILTLLILLFTGHSHSEDQKMLLDLRGKWKFSIGNDSRWADPSFNDAQWEEIYVPADWENEGFPNYDGYAWYRTSFALNESTKNKLLFLHLGKIDDVSEVYLNGKYLGGYGSFPPQMETAYDQDVILPVVPSLLTQNGRNVLAVKVYDDFRNGGIVSGKIGLFEHRSDLEMEIPLADIWKFKTGDDVRWKEIAFNDDNWKEQVVPSSWDIQGYAGYDGFAWYRIRFTVPEKMQSEQLVLMLGKIDDVDETYLNGELLGKTGRIKSDGTVGTLRDEYREYRAYTIPSSMLRYGIENVIAVRVYDGFKIGGIYEGPVGIVTRSTYRKWEREQKEYDNDLPRFLRKIFGE